MANFNTGYHNRREFLATSLLALSQLVTPNFSLGAETGALVGNASLQWKKSNPFIDSGPFVEKDKLSKCSLVRILDNSSNLILGLGMDKNSPEVSIRLCGIDKANGNKKWETHLKPAQNESEIVSDSFVVGSSLIIASSCCNEQTNERRHVLRNIDINSGDILGTRYLSFTDPADTKPGLSKSSLSRMLKFASKEGVSDKFEVITSGYIAAFNLSLNDVGQPRYFKNLSGERCLTGAGVLSLEKLDDGYFLVSNSGKPDTSTKIELPQGAPVKIYKGKDNIFYILAYSADSSRHFVFEYDVHNNKFGKKVEFPDKAGSTFLIWENAENSTWLAGYVAKDGTAYIYPFSTQSAKMLKDPVVCRADRAFMAARPISTSDFMVVSRDAGEVVDKIYLEFYNIEKGAAKLVSSLPVGIAPIPAKDIPLVWISKSDESQLCVSIGSQGNSGALLSLQMGVIQSVPVVK